MSGVIVTGRTSCWFGGGQMELLNVVQDRKLMTSPTSIGPSMEFCVKKIKDCQRVNGGERISSQDVRAV